MTELAIHFEVIIKLLLYKPSYFNSLHIRFLIYLFFNTIIEMYSGFRRPPESVASWKLRKVQRACSRCAVGCGCCTLRLAPWASRATSDYRPFKWGVVSAARARYGDAMETQRSNVALVMPAPDDPEYAAAAACTPKQEIFARTWAETGNKAAAYRAAFNPGPRTLPGTIWGSASTMSRLPQVLALYKVITHQAMLETIMTVRELFQLQVDIATADPTEIVKVVSRCCRHCYGQDHAYQWRDISEYTNECVVALDKQQMPPTDLGGYGFNGALEPVLTCPHCLGVGITHTEITPSDKLTGKARKLYAGAKEDRFGAIEVKLHDQQKAAELAGRILGAFNDKLDLRTPAEREKDEEQKRISKNVTAEDAARAYLSLVS